MCLCLLVPCYSDLSVNCKNLYFSHIVIKENLYSGTQQLFNSLYQQYTTSNNAGQKNNALLKNLGEQNKNMLPEAVEILTF